MEHKLDEYFRKKIDDVEDSLPENSSFDESLFWNTLQHKLDKSKSKSWWKWATIAACVGGLALWVVSISKVTPKTHTASYTKRLEPIMKPDCSLAVVYPKNIKEQTHKSKKKKIVEPKKDFKMEVEQLAIKVSDSPVQAPIIKQDSIHFKPLIVAEAKPQFKTIHVNEISNTEKTPIPQPKFKIRFAARNQQ